MQSYLYRKKKKRRINLMPTQTLVFGFLAIIFLGAVLLNLPIASQNGQSVGFINSLFTATSAVCVTGLVVVNTTLHWTLFGKLVILFLIQIGGLGFMAFATALFMMLGRKITLKERLIIQEATNQYSLSGMVRLTKNILIGTFIVEGIGALLLTLKFVPIYGARGLFYSVFHSISAFCNAGFDIMPGDASLTEFSGDVLVNFVIMLLIILGGLGFAVWLDIIKVSKAKVKQQFTLRNWFSKLSLHSKIVLSISAFLIIVGFIFFLIIEFNNPYTIGNKSFGQKIIAGMFHSVSTRTAGFNTIPMDKLTNASKFMTIILMFIGGSPAGTAGGIKTVTVGVIISTIISVIKGKERTEIYERTIPENIIRKAMAVIGISMTVVIIMTILLSISEKATFMEVFFEETSAFGTVGLSLGITSSLSNFGKILIAITMFIGRLGPMTMALAFTLKRKKINNNVKKPDERVMVG